MVGEKSLNSAKPIAPTICRIMDSSKLYERLTESFAASWECGSHSGNFGHWLCQGEYLAILSKLLFPSGSWPFQFEKKKKNWNKSNHLFDIPIHQATLTTTTGPRPPQAEIPPVTPHEFELACIIPVAENVRLLFSTTALKLKMRKTVSYVSRGRNASSMSRLVTSQSVKIVWGIQTQYSISFLYVALYHLIMMAGPIGFWVWWQKHHPDDLQNASIPMTTTAVLISLFWSYGHL